MNIVVLIGCTHSDLVCALCEQLRATTPDLTIRCEAADPTTLGQLAGRMKPDIVVVDDSGAQALARIQQDSPGTRILLVGGPSGQQGVSEAIRLGARGRLSGMEHPSLLARAVRRVHAGEAWFSRQVVFETLYERVRHQIQTVAASSVAPRLTDREREILHLIEGGLSNKEIGRHLDISDKTVKTHLHRVYVKFNQSGRFKVLQVHPRDAALRPLPSQAALPVQRPDSGASAGRSGDGLDKEGGTSDSVLPITFTSTNLVPRP